MSDATRDTAASAEDVELLVISVGVFFVLAPMYANALYARKLRGLVRRAKAVRQGPAVQAEWIRPRGGTSLAWMVLLLFIPILGILAAVALPAYQDYVIRANSARIQANYDTAVQFVVNDMDLARGQIDNGTSTAADIDASWDKGPSGTERGGSAHTPSTTTVPQLTLGRGPVSSQM